MATKPEVKARITVTKNGPYLVTGDVPIAKQTIVTDREGGSQDWREGEAVPHKESYALCRCGHSKTKPFCDGSHLKAHFEGTETASRQPYREQAQAFEGPTLMLTDVESLCAGARFCDPNGGVWRQAARSDDPEVRRNFLRQVNNCPSGRLVVWERASGKAVEHTRPVSIGLVEDTAEEVSGPYWVRGGIPLIAADGFGYEVRARMTLCRCGASSNKPFCDGSHVTVKFRDF